LYNNSPNNEIVHQPQYNIDTPQAEPNWELLQQVVDYMEWRKRADVIQLMSQLSDEDIDACSLDFQRRFWDQMVIADHEEALNYRGKYMDKPFGWDILRKIALEDPKLIIGKAEWYPENTTYQKQLRYLIQELGKEKMEEMIRARHNGLFRRMIRKIFDMDDPSDDIAKRLTSTSTPHTIVS
jgi:hypothetical protein